MRLIFGICLLFGYYSVRAIAPSVNDTILVEIRSTPFFYNVLKTPEGKVYTGTSKGVFEWKHAQYNKISDDKGYVVWDKNNNALTTTATLLGDYYGREFSHLLTSSPIQNAVGTIFNAYNQHNLYLVSDGILYIYDINPYSVIHRFKSVRSISNNYVGTYSGIYKGKEKMDWPTYTNGYIREYGDTTFICYDGLTIITKDEIRTLRFPLTEDLMIAGKKLGHLQDIYRYEKGGWFLATSTGLYFADEQFSAFEKILEQKGTRPPVLMGQLDEIIVFAMDSIMYRYHRETGEFNTDVLLSAPIIDGVVNKYTPYMITENALFRYRSEHGVEELVKFEDGHTLLPIDHIRYVIGTNKGLFLYNLQTQTLQTIIEGVEFNRHALHINKRTLYAGAINGLYVFDVNTLDNIIERNKQMQLHDMPEYTVKSNNENLFWIVVIVALGGALLFSLNRSRHYKKKYRKSVSDKKREVTVGDIESFIISDLPNMNINLISEHFGINNKQLYKILEPEKPGAVINRIRMLTLRKGWQRGAGIHEISKETGFSVSYIKKLQQNRNANG